MVFIRFPGGAAILETVEYFSDFLRKISAPNFLAIGIVVIVLWLLISGIRKGLKKGKEGKESEKKDDEG
jgi:Na+/H+ antiporter NhaD/arsenite permease-like protein